MAKLISELRSSRFPSRPSVGKPWLTKASGVLAFGFPGLGVDADESGATEGEEEEGDVDMGPETVNHTKRTTVLSHSW